MVDRTGLFLDILVPALPPLRIFFLPHSVMDQSKLPELRILFRRFLICDYSRFAEFLLVAFLDRSAGTLFDKISLQGWSAAPDSVAERPNICGDGVRNPRDRNFGQ